MQNTNNLNDTKMAIKNEQDGDNLLQKKFYFFGNKYEDAIIKYQLAANIYKYNKLWMNAAKIFIKIADCYKQLFNVYDIILALTDAYKCYKQYDPLAAIPIILQIIEYHTKNCNFSKMISLYEDIVQIYEVANNFSQSYIYYKKIIDVCEYDNEFNKIKARYNIKIADYLITIDSFNEASILYENVANYYVKDKFLKYCAQELFLNAGLCLLSADDMVSTKRFIDRWRNYDLDSRDNREYKFMENIISCYEKNNIDTFVLIIKEYESVNKLNNLKINLLTKIKTNLSEILF